MPRKLLTALTLTIATLAASAQEPSPRTDPAVAATVRAATASAVQNLQREVGTLPLSNRLTVAQFIRDLQAQDELNKALDAADQIGEPRWTSQTCQVQLAIPAVRVATALKRIAASNRSSPLTAADIERAAENWPSRTITAVGTSAAPAGLRTFRPREGEKWRAVSDQSREAALMAAKDAAARRAIDSVAPVILVERKTVGDALSIPEVGRPVIVWLAARPVSRVDFRDDLQVEVALAVDPQDFFEEFRTVAEKQPTAPVPQSSSDWRRIEREFTSRLQPAVGRAPAKTEREPQTMKVSSFHMPQQMPEWADQILEVKGQSDPAGSKLRTGRKAELDANDKLRDQIEKLPLDSKTTLAQAARDDRRISDAITRTLRRSRMSKIEYLSDGSAIAHLSVDLRGLWEDLRR